MTSTTQRRNSSKEEEDTGILFFFNKLQRDLALLLQLNGIKWKNKTPTTKDAYQPTEIEHIANVVTHGFWILPSIYAAIHLLNKSKSSDQLTVSLIYGGALSFLFIISTFFHCVFYCNKNRQLRNFLHRCDRAMIYIFIAGSYFPWLNLGHSSHPLIISNLKWIIWLLAGIGILYQQLFHERFKNLETVFYLIISIGPAIVVILCGHEFLGMNEIKLGGLLYLVGICFFKMDGKIPMAHSIWHIFVVLAASIHYFAVLNYLYSEQFEHNHPTANNHQLK